MQRLDQEIVSALASREVTVEPDAVVREALPWCLGRPVWFGIEGKYGVFVEHRVIMEMESPLPVGLSQESRDFLVRNNIHPERSTGYVFAHVQFTWKGSQRPVKTPDTLLAQRRQLFQKNLPQRLCEHCPARPQCPQHHPELREQDPVVH